MSYEQFTIASLSRGTNCGGDSSPGVVYVEVSELMQSFIDTHLKTLGEERT